MVLRFSILIFVLTLLSCVKKEYSSIDSTNEVKPRYGIPKAETGLDSMTEKQWDSINGNPIIKEQQYKDTLDRHEKYKTFGWHLYSKGTAYKQYDFSKLWGIAYFSYEVNPNTGSYKTIHNWKTTGLVESAKAKECKVFLTVTNFGRANNRQFLTNKKAQQRLQDSLISLLSYRNADGINIDFEGMHGESKEGFTSFIQGLSKRLKEGSKKYILTLSLYAVDTHKVFDIKQLNKSVDVYTLMGYDYYGGFSKHAGPIAPLEPSRTFGQSCVAESVKYYLNQGLAKDKLIVGLPYYGGLWETTGEKLPRLAKKFEKHLSYASIKSDFIINRGMKPRYEASVASAYIDIGNNQQLWFDDSLSLAKKYDYVKEKELAGVGIWALGYDEGDSELWQLLGDKFGNKNQSK